MKQMWTPRFATVQWSMLPAVNHGVGKDAVWDWKAVLCEAFVVCLMGLFMCSI